MRFRLTAKRRDISRTRRFVSQFVERTTAAVNGPSGRFGGMEEISSTTKSSGPALIVPPIPGVEVAHPSMPTVLATSATSEDTRHGP